MRRHFFESSKPNSLSSEITLISHVMYHHNLSTARIWLPLSCGRHIVLATSEYVITIPYGEVTCLVRASNEQCSRPMLVAKLLALKHIGGRRSALSLIKHGVLNRILATAPDLASRLIDDILERIVPKKTGKL